MPRLWHGYRCREDENMQRIHTSSDIILIGQLEQILSSNGIATLVKNQHLFGAIGELPEFECWPELWVTRDTDEARARELVQAFMAESAEASADEQTGTWQCPGCNEVIEPPFYSCWNCGTERPSEPRSTS